MIGTVLRLGFDGTSISRGLGNITGLLGRFGKQVGIGASRQVGVAMTDTLGKIIGAIPNALMETADWAGSLNDMANQTGVSVEKLVTLQEALRLSGAEAADTSRIVSVLADNLNSATADSPASEALKKLGLEAENLKNLGIDKAFYQIGQRVAELNKITKTPVTFTDEFGNQSTKIVETITRMEGLETVMSDLFGAKMGYKLIRFFSDFDGNMEQAKNNVGGLATSMEKNAASIDTAFDALGRFGNLTKELSGITLSETIGRFPGGINAIFDGLDAQKLQPKIQELVTMIGRNLETVMQIGLGKLLGDGVKDLGKSFGEGIKEAVFGAGSKGGAGSFLPRLFGMGGTASNDNTAPLIEDTNSILNDIRKNTTTAYFS